VHASPNASIGPLILVIDNYWQETKDVGVEMYSSLMGSFDFVAPIHHIHAISSRYSLPMRSIHFRTSYFNDPWTLTSLTMSCKGQSHIGMEIPLSLTEVPYQDILNTIVDPDPFSLQMDEEYLILDPVWVTQSSCSHELLNDTLPSKEAILEAMYGLDRPWDDMHHCS
jgi:hypothetical protein